jgi:hypothetical protein
MSFTHKQKKNILSNIIKQTINNELEWKQLKSISIKFDIYQCKYNITKKKSIYLQLIKRHTINGLNFYLDIYYHLNNNRNHLRININGKLLSNIATIFISEYNDIFLLYVHIKYNNIYTKNKLNEYLYNYTVINDIIWEKDDGIDNFIYYDSCYKGQCVKIKLNKNNFQILYGITPISYIIKTPKILFNIIKKIKNNNE